MPPLLYPFPAVSPASPRGRAATGHRLLSGLFLALAAPALLSATPEVDATDSSATAAPPRLSQYVPAGYAYHWGDTFDGPAIDPAKWIVASLRDPVNGDHVPGAAGDHLLNKDYLGYITPDDSFIEDGALVLLNQKRDFQGTSPARLFHYTSGWVMSMNRGSFNQGYLEVRAQFPRGDRVWPAIWLIPESLTWGPEWDIWEYFGHRKDVGLDNMGLHLMTGRYDRQNWNYHWLKNFHRDYRGSDWHIYGFEWTSTEAKWWINGTLVYTLARSATKRPELWPNDPMYIVLNNGVRRLSTENDTVYPNRLVIDYLEVYTKPTSPALPAAAPDSSP